MSKRPYAPTERGFWVEYARYLCGLMVVVGLGVIVSGIAEFYVLTDWVNTQFGWLGVLVATAIGFATFLPLQILLGMWMMAYGGEHCHEPKETPCSTTP